MLGHSSSRLATPHTHIVVSVGDDTAATAGFVRHCGALLPDAAKYVNRFTYLAFFEASWHSLPGKWHRGRMEI
jgi:hypothetical protein